MSRSTWCWVVLGISSLALSGCQEPTDIITASPPGADNPRPLPASEKDPAQALGEQAVSRPAVTKRTESASTISPAKPTAKGEVKTTASGVKYETLKEGSGPEAQSGQKAKVHYTGTLESGKKFDSSRDRDAPFVFTLGTGMVIKGWDEGVTGMHVGERRKLIIPAAAGYGANGSPPDIPPNATLYFDIELLGLE